MRQANKSDRRFPALTINSFGNNFLRDIPPHEAFPPHHHPLPPHLRHNQLQISFDAQDWEILCRVFGDEDTASAAARIISMSPPEMKVTAFQLIDLIKESE